MYAHLSAEAASMGEGLPRPSLDAVADRLGTLAARAPHPPVGPEVLDLRPRPPQGKGADSAEDGAWQWHCKISVTRL